MLLRCLRELDLSSIAKTSLAIYPSKIFQYFYSRNEKVLNNAFMIYRQMVRYKFHDEINIIVFIQRS